MIFYLVVFISIVSGFILFYGIIKILFRFFEIDISNNPEALVRAGFYDRAIKVYRDILEKDPDNLVTKLNFSKVLIMKKFDEPAMFELEDILRISGGKSFPEESETLHLLRELYMKTYKKCEEFLTLRKILVVDCNNTEVHMRIAEFLIGNFKFEESLSNLDKIIEIEPDNYKARFHKGMVLFELGKEKHGVAVLEELLLKNTEFVQAFQTLGHHYLKSDPAKAFQFFQNEKEFSKELINKTEASVMMAYIHSLNGDWKGAAEEVKDWAHYADKLDSQTAADLYLTLAVANTVLEKNEDADMNWHLLVKTSYDFLEIFERQKSRNTLKTNSQNELLRFWREHFSKKKARSITDTLASLQISNINRMSDFNALNSMFNKWIEERGVTSNGNGKKADLIKVTDSRSLTESSISDFKETIEKIVIHLGYKIEHEFMTSDGYDATVLKNKEKFLLLARKWSGKIGELQISQIVTDFKKRNYDRGILLCCGKFSSSGKDLAKKSGILLYDAAKLDAVMSELKPPSN